MIGRTNGGSAGVAYAYISVSYAPGAICTCSYNGRTLRARDTSGSFVFGVPSPGSWVVSITKNGLTNSRTIQIASEHQVEFVVVPIPVYLWGDGIVSESAWTFVGKAYNSTYTNAAIPVHSVTDGVMSLYVTATSSQTLRGGLSYFTTPVDLTDYSTLEMVGGIFNGDAAEDGCGLVIYSSVPTYLTSTARAKIDVGARNATLTDPTIDISSLTGTGIIGIKLIARYNETRGSASITSLRLR